MEFSEADRSRIRTLVELFPEKTEVSVAKIVRTKPSFLGLVKTSSGVSEVENNSDVFEIGSITKVFTASVLASMVLKGRLGVDSTIDQCVALKLKDNQSLTLRDLASHNSGLPFMPPGILWEALFKNRENPTKDYDERRLLDYLENSLKLKKKKIAYSNLGFGVLGYVLARFSGCSYEDLVRNELFSPLGLSNSTSERSNVTNRLVVGLDAKGRAVEYSDLGIFAGAGSVLSNVEDLVKFALANFDENNDMLTLQRKAVVEDKHQCMALGWLIARKAQKGERMYFHDGGTRGFSSAIFIDTLKRNGIVLLSNISGMHKFKGNKTRQLVVELMNDLVSSTGQT